MSEHTEASSAEKRLLIPITELLLPASTVVAAAIAVRMTDPTIPPIWVTDSTIQNINRKGQERRCK